MREVKESKKREKKRRGERKEGKEVALVRKMRTAHFRGDAWQKCDFAAHDLSEKQKGTGQVRHKPRLPFRFSLV